MTIFDLSAEWMPSSEHAETLDGIIPRLALFVSGTDTQPDGNDLKTDLHTHLFLQTLAESPKDSLSINEIKESSRRLFQLDFDEVEILEVAEKMKAAGKITEVKAPRSEVDPVRYFAIHPRLKTKIETSVFHETELKREVVQTWLSDIENRVKRSLTEEEKEILTEDLNSYLVYLFVERGSQAILTAYNCKDEFIDFVELLDQKPKLKKRKKELHELRESAIEQFFANESMDKKRAKFILGLIDSAFLLSILHLDTNMSGLARNAFRDKQIFLDSNIIYRLLGLQTESLTGMTRRVIEASQLMGCKLLVSSISVEELKTSLERSVEYLKRNPPVSREYEELKLQFISEDRGFVIAYWKDFAKNGTPLDHFANKYRHIEKILEKQYNIAVSSDHVHKIQGQERLLNLETHNFLKYLEEEAEKRVNMNDRLYSHRPRLRSLAKHDVTLLQIVQEIRPKSCRNFSDVSAWLLTADGHLINYSRRHKLTAEKSTLPIAIHSRDWLLFLRPWLPRTKDFDRAAVALISSARFRSFSGLNPYLIDLVTRILASYKDMTPGLAAEMLADHGLTQQLLSIQRKVEQELSEVEPEDIRGDPQQYLDNLAHQISKEELSNAVEAAALRVANAKEQERAQISFENYKTRQELDSTKNRFNALESEHNRLKMETKEEIKTKSSKIKRLEAEMNATERELEEARATINSDQTKIATLQKSQKMKQWFLGISIGVILIFVVAPFIAQFIPIKFVYPFWLFVYPTVLLLTLAIGVGTKVWWKYFKIIETILSFLVIIWTVINIFSGQQ